MPKAFRSSFLVSGNLLKSKPTISRYILKTDKHKHIKIKNSLLNNDCFNIGPPL